MTMHPNGNDGHPIRDSLIDAAAAAGAAFFGTLAGMSVAGILGDAKAAALAAIISFGVAFFASLQAARKRS